MLILELYKEDEMKRMNFKIYINFVYCVSCGEDSWEK